MSKSAGTTTSTSTSQPNSKYLDEVLQQAQNLYKSAGPTYYPNKTVAGTPDVTETARNYMQSFASSQAAPMVDQAQDAWKKLVGGDYLDVANNPYVQGAIKSSTSGVTEQLLEQALPAIRGGAQLAGQYGGSRQALAEANAIGEAADSATKAASNISLGAYNSGLSALLSGLGQTGAIQGYGQNVYNMLTQIGTSQQAQSQAEIDAAIKQWEYEQNLPYNKLLEYSNLASQALGTTTQTATTYPETSAGLQIASTIATALPSLASLFNVIRGIF